MKHFTWILFSALVIATASSFKGKPKAPIKLDKSFTNSFAFIPQGTASFDGETHSAGAFFMSKAEVSNAQYRAFLAEVESDNPERLKASAVQASRWVKEGFNSEPFKEFYHTHPAYDGYPVVTISHAAAEAYCAWLTEKYQTAHIGLSDDMQIIFRLPTRAEWIMAASGGIAGPYAWGGPYLSNAKGERLANFLTYGAENIHRNTETGVFEIVKLPVYVGTPGNINSHADVTAPVLSYSPNRFGLYNMNGNVAEMLTEPGVAAGGGWTSTGYDIRNESIMHFEGASPNVGFRPIAVLGPK